MVSISNREFTTGLSQGSTLQHVAPGMFIDWLKKRVSTAVTTSVCGSES